MGNNSHLHPLESVWLHITFIVLILSLKGIFFRSVNFYVLGVIQSPIITNFGGLLQICDFEVSPMMGWIEFWNVLLGTIAMKAALSRDYPQPPKRMKEKKKRKEGRNPISPLALA